MAYENPFARRLTLQQLATDLSFLAHSKKTRDSIPANPFLDSRQYSGKFWAFLKSAQTAEEKGKHEHGALDRRNAFFTAGRHGDYELAEKALDFPLPLHLYTPATQITISSTLARYYYQTKDEAEMARHALEAICVYEKLLEAAPKSVINAPISTDYIWDELGDCYGYAAMMSETSPEERVSYATNSLRFILSEAVEALNNGNPTRSEGRQKEIKWIFSIVQTKSETVSEIAAFNKQALQILDQLPDTPGSTTVRANVEKIYLGCLSRSRNKVYIAARETAAEEKYVLARDLYKTAFLLYIQAARASEQKNSITDFTNRTWAARSAVWLEEEEYIRQVAEYLQSAQTSDTPIDLEHESTVLKEILQGSFNVNDLKTLNSASGRAERLFAQFSAESIATQMEKSKQTEYSHSTLRSLGTCLMYSSTNPQLSWDSRCLLSKNSIQVFMISYQTGNKGDQTAARDFLRWAFSIMVRTPADMDNLCRLLELISPLGSKEVEYINVTAYAAAARNFNHRAWRIEVGEHDERYIGDPTVGNSALLFRQESLKLFDFVLTEVENSTTHTEGWKTDIRLSAAKSAMRLGEEDSYKRLIDSIPLTSLDSTQRLITYAAVRTRSSYHLEESWSETGAIASQMLSLLKPVIPYSENPLGTPLSTASQRYEAQELHLLHYYRMIDDDRSEKDTLADSLYCTVLLSRFIMSGYSVEWAEHQLKAVYQLLARLSITVGLMQILKKETIDYLGDNIQQAAIDTLYPVLDQAVLVGIDTAGSIAQGEISGIGDIGSFFVN